MLQSSWQHKILFRNWWDKNKRTHLSLWNLPIWKSSKLQLLRSPANILVDSREEDGEGKEKELIKPMSGWNWDQETPLMKQWREGCCGAETNTKKQNSHFMKLWRVVYLFVWGNWYKGKNKIMKIVNTNNNNNKWYYNNWHEWKMVPWKSGTLYWERRDRDWKGRRGIPEEQWVIKIGDWIESAEQRGCPPLNSEREREKTENM